MINVSFADPWLHVTARGLWQALSSLCYSSYTSQRMQTQFSGGFSGSEGVIAPLNCVDIKLRILIFETQLIVATYVTQDRRGHPDYRAVQLRLTIYQ